MLSIRSGLGLCVKSAHPSLGEVIRRTTSSGSETVAPAPASGMGYPYGSDTPSNPNPSLIDGFKVLSRRKYLVDNRFYDRIQRYYDSRLS